MSESPEATGEYKCPCGNTTDFIGIDGRGYPGPEECYCGNEECTCEVELRQRLKVSPDGEVDYGAFTGGGCGAEISSYTRIQCVPCGRAIYDEETDPAVRAANSLPRAALVDAAREAVALNGEYSE